MNSSPTSRSCGPCRFITTVTLRRSLSSCSAIRSSKHRVTQKTYIDMNIDRLSEQTVLRDDKDGKHTHPREKFQE